MLAHRPFLALLGRPQPAASFRNSLRRFPLHPSVVKRPLRAQSVTSPVHRLLDSASAAAPEDSFYNRTTEQENFNDMFSGEPGLMTVLVGPRNSGKTRFLKKLAAEFEAEENGPPFMYINSRLTKVTTPEKISEALCEVLMSPNLLEKVRPVSEKLLVKFAAQLKAPSVGGDHSHLPLQQLFNYLQDDRKNLGNTIKKSILIFEELNSLQLKPVLVIDEANKLMKWKAPNPAMEQLEELLDFLVAISKEANLVHVVLATSDFSLVNRLAGKGLAEDKFRIEVIGDLTEEEAKTFIYGEGNWRGIINKLSNEYKKVPDDGGEAQWDEIYKRCGGNIGLLRQCVLEARVKGDWTKALAKIVETPRSGVMSGFDPAGMAKKDVPPLWIETHWRAVLRRIVNAEHHAVLRSELEAELDDHIKGDVAAANGKAVLLSMVKYNLVAIRPFSDLARDLPEEVYGDNMEEVVTLPSPAHLYAAKKVMGRRI